MSKADNYRGRGRAFSSFNKLGIVATVNNEDSVHISLLNSIRAKTTKELWLSEFTKGP